MTIMPMDGGLGGRPQPWDKRRGGLFGASPVTQPAMTAEPSPMTPKKGFDWGKLIGVLGDSLSIAGGGQAMYVPNLIDQRNRRQAQEYAEQTYQRRRGDEWSDWEKQQQWQRDNPKPRDPTNFEQILDAAGVQGDERIKLLRMKAQNEAQGVPMAVDITNPDGSVGRQYIRPGSIGSAQPPPQRPIGKLTPYGGGQTATPSGNFR